MNWLSRFSEMVETLQQHPQVHFSSYQTFPSLEIEQLETLEKKYNVKVPSDVRQFYSETNGLQLLWIFKNNEHYDEEKFLKENKPLSWDFFQKTFRWEDGGVMILPLEKVLEEKRLDVFSENYNIVITDDDFNLTISEEDIISDDFLTTNFISYLEFLIASKGLISRRTFFYARPDYFTEKNPKQIFTPPSFWTKEKVLHLDQAILKDQFPKCDQIRFFENKINRQSLQILAKNGDKISSIQLEEIIEKHHQFLMNGGVGGDWKVLEIRGIVTAFYHQIIEVKEGEQANFERKNLTDISFENIELPYSNCCSVFAEGVNFSNANFEKSLFTDCFLQNANFHNTNLTSLDFSRSDLRNVNFKNAKLRNVDFENCDLRGANFDKADLEGASFVGAILI